MRLIAMSLCLSVISAPAADKVTVYCNKTTHRMPSIGHNMTYEDGGHGIVDPTTGKFNPKAVAAYKMLKPGWLRFPGGTISNIYDWKRAIGPQEQRQMQPHGWGTHMHAESSAWGPDEAGRFVELVGGQMVVCVSFGKGAQDAADHVAYLNLPVGSGNKWAKLRAANGHPEPYGVVHFEIGNESGGSEICTWPSYPFSGDEHKKGGVNQGTEQSVDWWVNGGTKEFKNQKAVGFTSWHNDDIKTEGEPGETRYVKFPPAMAITVSIGESAESSDPWKQVKRFSSSNPTDKHFMFDEKTGAIRFGDGKHGLVPPTGKFVFADYTSGPHDGYIEICRAMRKIDPSIKITASHFGLIKEAGTNGKIKFDGIQQHGMGFNQFFKTPLNNDPFTDAVGRGYFQFRNNLESETLRQIEKFGLPKNTLVTCSEFSPGQGLGQSLQSIAGSLLLALCYEAGSRDGYVEILGPNYLRAGQNKLSHLQNDDFFIAAPALAGQMFCNHFGTHRLKVDSKVSTRTIEWRSKSSIKKGETHTGEIPNLVVLASRDKSAFYIMGINTTKADPVAADIGLAAFRAGSGAAEAWIIHSDSIDEFRTLENPAGVRLEKLGNLPDIGKAGFTHTFPPASVTSIRIPMK